MVIACPECQGRGFVVLDRCDDCRGAGRIPVDRRIEVKIPAGIHDGQAVRIAGEGEPPPQESDPAGSGTPGDLHVVTRVGQHEQFERDGNHLLLVLPTVFTQLALGSTVEVPGIGEGEVHSLELPPGTQHGALFRISGGGLPDLRTNSRGDIVSIIHLVVPNKLDTEQRELLEQYATMEDLDLVASSPSLWNRIKDAVTGRG